MEKTLYQQVRRTERAKKSLWLSLAMALSLGAMGVSAHPAVAAVGDNKIFSMQVSTGAAACLRNAKGWVTVTNVGPVENLHVEVSGLKPNTDYDLFLIQVPDSPFGLA